MPGFTPNFHLPWPAVGEPMRDTRQRIQEALEAIDAALLAGPASPPDAQALVQVAGRVTTLERGRARRLVKSSSDSFSVGTGAAWTLLPFPSQGPSTVRNQGLWSSASPGRLTATVDGYWRFTAGCNGVTHIQIRTNAVGYPGAQTGTMQGADNRSAANFVHCEADEVFLTAGQYAEVYVLNTVAAGAAGSTAGYTAYFTASYLGADSGTVALP